jgi:hypothetical protein
MRSRNNSFGNYGNDNSGPDDCLSNICYQSCLGSQRPCSRNRNVDFATGNRCNDCFDDCNNNRKMDCNCDKRNCWQTQTIEPCQSCQSCSCNLPNNTSWCNNTRSSENQLCVNCSGCIHCESPGIGNCNCTNENAKSEVCKNCTASVNLTINNCSCSCLNFIRDCNNSNCSSTVVLFNNCTCNCTQPENIQEQEEPANNQSQIFEQEGFFESHTFDENKQAEMDFGEFSNDSTLLTNSANFSGVDNDFINGSW